MTDQLDEAIGQADPALALVKSQTFANAAVDVAEAAVRDGRRPSRKPLWHGHRGLVLLGGGAAALLLTAGTVIGGMIFANVAGQPVAITGTATSAAGESCTVGLWVLPQEELYDAASGMFSLDLSKAENLIGKQHEVPFDPRSGAGILGGADDGGNQAPVFDRSRFEHVRDAVTGADWSAEVATAVSSSGDKAEISLRLAELVESRLEAEGQPLDVNTTLFASTRCDAE